MNVDISFGSGFGLDGLKVISTVCETGFVHVSKSCTTTIVASPFEIIVAVVSSVACHHFDIVVS